MKKCIICELVEDDDAKPTCRGCGEASWQLSESSKPAEPPPKRGPGRPKKAVSG